MNGKVWYLILGLCLFVHEARVYGNPSWLGGSHELPHVAENKATREQFDALVKRSNKLCSVRYFTEFERLTASGMGGYDGAEQHQHDKLKMKLLKECEQKFVQNFEIRVTELGPELEKKLVSLARNIKEARVNPLISNKLGFFFPDGSHLLGILSFMGEQAAFSGTTKLSADEFKDKYETIFRESCVSAAKLEPTAEIFRMYQDYRPEVFAKVEDSVFELASVSGACLKLGRRATGENDYKIYCSLWNNQALPGEPRSEKAKSDHKKRVDLLLATEDKCTPEFFSQLDVLIDDARLYTRRQGAALLENQRSKLFDECKPTFEQKFMDKVGELDSSESDKLIALGNEVFGEGKMTDDSFELAEGILKYMKRADSEIKQKKLSEDEFDKRYQTMILDLCSSVNAKIDSAASILHTFERRFLVHDHNTNKSTMLWLRRSTLCRKVDLYYYSTREAYANMKKPSKFGCLLRGKGH